MTAGPAPGLGTGPGRADAGAATGATLPRRHLLTSAALACAALAGCSVPPGPAGWWRTFPVNFPPPGG